MDNSFIYLVTQSFNFEKLFIFQCSGVKVCRTCDTEGMECYVLDSNAYIIISEKKEDTGKFFGEIRGNIMESLVAETIYRRVHMYDYQAVCFRGEGVDPSSSTRLHTVCLLYTSRCV